MRCQNCALDGAKCPTPNMSAAFVNDDWDCAFGRRRTALEASAHIEVLWEASTWEQPHHSEVGR